ncbi:MAG TPA: hypothetical protein PK014_08265 [Thermoanaerobaculia bacterium]|nr:hypothetical protein [Thermoanaerobaculia bacterium]HUM30177.1 hypothetical protein [Thermoanaerobaculia bacterium]HXK68374.1 hypothetical protein [Thermoanaerobaculia bacterium]
MSYDTESNILYLSTRVMPTEKMSLSLGLSYVTSTAGMNMIQFTPISQEAADALGHEDYDFSAVHTYSDLDISRLELNGDMTLQLSKKVGVVFGFLLSDYKDDDPYLQDTGGTYSWVWTGLKFWF